MTDKCIKFLLKFLILCLLVGLFCFLIVMPQYSTGYLASFKDKYLLEHAQTDFPRIILMGDSNVAFGIDSERIEEAFDRPVVNMGLHGGLGQAFCMDLAKSGIRENDIVIVLPAWFDFSESTLDATLAWTLLENDVTLWKEVNTRDYGTLAEGYPAYLKRALNLWINQQGNQENPGGGDERSAFNEYGDIITTGDQNIMNQGYDPNTKSEYVVNQDLLNYYNKYNQYVSDRGAVMLMGCAPIIDAPDRWDDKEYETKFSLVEHTLEFLLISEWEDYVYPTEYFYDTNFHLNDTGRKFRTEQLINDIRSWMESTGQE